MKRLAGLLIIFLLLQTQFAFSAQKIPVEITPAKKITTSKPISEGDFVQFKVLNSDDIVRGIIAKYEPNGFGGKEAVLVIEDFKTLNSSNKYSGTIVLSGNQHNQIMDFFTVFAEYVRGGEITVKPNKDIFNLWMEK